MTQTQYPCAGCGAGVEFAPGTTVLRCPYCGHETPLTGDGRVVREHDFRAFAALPRKPVGTLAPHVFTCRNCGAQTTSDRISDRCRFCGAPLVATADGGEQVVPEAVLPFAVEKAAVREHLRGWVRTRWFAPSQLKKVTEAESAHSTYLPHWTFDSDTRSHYSGQRGDHYYVTETYTETVNGQSQTRQRQVRRTRWTSVSGQVSRTFDDVLVAGTTHVTPGHLDALEPWPLTSAEPYRPEFLAGHETLRYDVEPEAGFGVARGRMDAQIRDDARRDIGGDEQQVHDVDTDFRDLRFKLMLLPVWIACYLHAGHTYTVLVNGRTGEVAGERPYSKPKIAAAVLAALALITAIVLFLVLRR
jgi:DNA-directed RNA polymerase subunit RPC12/RpoP